MPSISTSSLRVRDRSTRHIFVFGLGTSGSHPRRHIDLLANVVIVALPANSFDQYAQKHKPIVTVDKASAWLERHVPLPVQIHVVLKRAKFFAMGIVLRAENVTSPSNLHEEMLDLDLGRKLCIRIVQYVFPDGVI